MTLTIEAMRIEVPSELGHRANAIGHATVRSLSGSRIASDHRSCDRLVVNVPHEHGASNEAIGTAIAEAILIRLSEGD